MQLFEHGLSALDIDLSTLGLEYAAAAQVVEGSVVRGRADVVDACVVGIDLHIVEVDGISFGLLNRADEVDGHVRLALKRAEVDGVLLPAFGGALTEIEKDMLPVGAMVMTFECGMRFLTDYLEGDHYFKIHREGHNLDRCRTQFKLVKDMEEKLQQMKDIVKKYR